MSTERPTLEALVVKLGHLIKENEQLIGKRSKIDT